MNSLVSIILPIYNVAPHLKTCLESLLNQSYKNMEIILVNDGSTDYSGVICEMYQTKYDQIYVIHQKNVGVSVARNIGLAHARGDYICFADPEDVLDKHMIERLYQINFSYQADISMCGFRMFMEGGSLNKSIRGESLVTEIKKTKYIKKLTSIKKNIEDMKHVVVWNKMYKKHLFRDIQFRTGGFHEDELIIHFLVDASRTIYATEEILYNHRIRKRSMLEQKKNGKKNKRSSENNLSVITAFRERVALCEKSYPEVYAVMLRSYIRIISIQLQQMYASSNAPSYWKVRKLFQQEIERYNAYLTNMDKLKYKVVYDAPGISYQVFSILQFVKAKIGNIQGQ